MKKYFAIGIMALLISCSKEKESVDPRECAKNQTGNIFVDNRTKYDFYVNVNGKDQGVVLANNHILVTVRFDSDILVSVRQKSGFTLTDNIKSGSVDVEMCEETLFRFY